MINIYEMYMTMIRNGINKKSIKELESIKEVINLMPMKYFIEEKITLTQAKELTDMIEENIKLIEGE